MKTSIEGESLWQWYLWASEKISMAMLPLAEQANLRNELIWVLTTVSSVDRLALRLETYRSCLDITLTQSLTDLSDLWQKRIDERVPLQYLLGQATWRDFTVSVAPGVLIPRPETELIIDLVREATPVPWEAPQRWADLGTGSGAIALGLARLFPKATIYAVDLSPAALQIAAQNARSLGVISQIHFSEGKWLAPLAKFRQSLASVTAEQLHGIVSNPPYIPSALVPTLQPEVCHHEPWLALDGGDDGLDAIRDIAQAAPDYLMPNGVLIMEMMIGQAATAYEILDSQNAYQEIQIHPDLAGIERFIQARRRR
jgi:release factor glutamine methyltransferase